MALVRINYSAKKLPTFGREIGLIVNRVMHEVLTVPYAENYVVASAHERDQIIHTNPDLQESTIEDIVFIQITLNQGRSDELKKRFFQIIKGEITQTMGLPTSQIYINLVEVDKANWAFSK